MRLLAFLTFVLISGGLIVISDSDSTCQAPSSEGSRVLSSISTQTSPEKSVRSELIQLQKSTGLTLAAFYRGLQVINFSDRSLIQGKEPSVAGSGLEGAISRDGDEIAVDVFRTAGGPDLAIIRRDGSVLQEFPNIRAQRIGWSYDKSHLAINVQVPGPAQSETIYTNLILLNVATKEVQQVSGGGDITSECWSPDGKHIVYEVGNSISVYDIDKKEVQVLGTGKFATWSSDGQWLAFLDKNTYYAINPSGEGRKVLFRKNRAMSGLWWSPDSKIVAFLSQNSTFEGPLTLDIELVRLRVRRLADGSEDWVAKDSAAYLPSYQWVTNPQLIQGVESGTTSR